MDTASVAGNDAPSRPQHARNQSRTPRVGHDRRPAFHRSRTSENNANSDKVTASFIRRTLCAHIQLDGRPAPVDELLPPLTSSNEVDLQIYAIIAVVLREFVQQWYGKITPDHTFVDEIITTIAHCTRALEQRAKLVDWESVILDEIPGLLLAHTQTVEEADQARKRNILGASAPDVYHTLLPHPALDPVPDDDNDDTVSEQADNQAAWRQLLSQGMLAILLPAEDFDNRCLRTLVAEILSEMVLGNVVGNRMSEPYVLLEIIAKTLERIRPPRQDEDIHLPEPSTNEQVKTQRLEKSGLLNTDPEEPMESTSTRSRSSLAAKRQNITASVMRTIWTVLSTMFLIFTVLRTTASILMSSATMPSRKYAPVNSSEKLGTLYQVGTQEPRPMLSMQVWSLVSALLQLKHRMPWLAGSLSLSHDIAINGFMRVGAVDSRLDRLLSHTFHTRVLDPNNIPTTLRSIRAAIFPSNTFPKSTPAAITTASADPINGIHVPILNNPPVKAVAVPPSPADTSAMKRRCATAIINILPPIVAKTYFCPRWVQPDTDWTASAVEQAESLFGFLGDKYMNKHLIFSLVELLVVRLMPELGEQGITSLLAERLGDESMI